MKDFEKVVNKYQRLIMNLAIKWENSTKNNHIDRHDYFSAGLEVLWSSYKKHKKKESTAFFRNYLCKGLRNRFLGICRGKDNDFEAENIINILDDKNINIIESIEVKNVDSNYNNMLKIIEKRLPDIHKSIFYDIEKTKNKKARYGNTYSLEVLRKKYKLSKTMIMKHIDSIRKKVSEMIKENVI